LKIPLIINFVYYSAFLPSSIRAQLKPHLKGCCEVVLPEVTWTEVTSVTWPEMTSGHVTSGSTTSQHHLKCGLSCAHILLPPDDVYYSAFLLSGDRHWLHRYLLNQLPHDHDDPWQPVNDNVIIQYLSVQMVLCFTNYRRLGGYVF
jgi:hypothetical protein